MFRSSIPGAPVPAPALTPPPPPPPANAPGSIFGRLPPPPPPLGSPGPPEAPPGPLLTPPGPPLPPFSYVPLSHCPRISTYWSRFAPGCDGVIELAPGSWKFLSSNEEKKRAQEPGRAERPLMHATCTVQQAFGSQFTHTDEHCTLYGILDPQGAWTDRCARFTTSAIADWPDFKEALSGCELRGTMLALDFDLPGKATWTEGWRTEMTSLFERLFTTGSVLARPSTFYTTGHGFRLVYVLSRPVAIDGPGGLQDLLIGLVVEAFGNGLNVDANCIDWTRMFRLARVWRRDERINPGYPTWKADYFRQSWGRVACNEIEDAPKGGVYLVHNPLAFTAASALTAEEIARRNWKLDRPECQVLRKYLGHAPGPGVSKSTRPIGEAVTTGSYARLIVSENNQDLPETTALKHLLKQAATSTKTVEGDALAGWALKVLFLGAPLWEGIESGAEGMHRSINNLAYILCRVLGMRLSPDVAESNPQFLHALILRTAMKANAMMPAQRARSEEILQAETWRSLEHYYRKALGRTEHREVLKSEQAELARSIAMNAFTQQHDELERLKAHLHSVLTQASPEAEAWIAQNAPHFYLVEGPDGTAVCQRSNEGLSWSLPCESVAGVVSLIRDSGLAHFGATMPPLQPGGEVRYKTMVQLLNEYGHTAPEVRASRKVKQSGPELQWLGDRMKVRYVERWGGMRTDVPPVHSADVDAYLKALAGDDSEYYHLCDWLHFYPQLDERICALYLYGASGIGKSVLGKALRVLTENNMSAPIEMLMDDFSEIFTQTPLLWTDEFAQVGWDQNRTLLDVLKKAVDGGTEPMNRKGKARIAVDSNWRILITANDNQVIKPGRDATPETRAALIPRLMFLDVTKSAERVSPFVPLMMPQRWAESVIPRHIMWLREEWKVRYPGKRYAKEGMWTKEHDELMTTSKAGKLTMEAVARLLLDPKTGRTAFKIFKEGLWVHLTALSDEVRSKVQGRDVDHEQVRQTMHQYASEPRDVQTMKNSANRSTKMLRLDPIKLFAYFYDHQMDCDFRPFVDNDALWRAWAPAQWVAELNAVEPERSPAQERRRPPPPPPSNVIKMPTTGFQKAHE